MKNFIRALIVGVIVGFVVGIICYAIGAIPHFTDLRLYDYYIGLAAGGITFLFRWDQIK